MIRTAYPIAPLRRVQLRLELAARRTRYALQARRKDLACRSYQNILIVEVPPQAVKVAPVSAIDAQAAFEAFYDKYDALTALICLAAQEGVTPARESRYQAARDWFLHAYPSGIAGIKEWENYGADDTEETGDETSLFAGFWTSPTLTQQLQNDDGSLIERMEKSYDVLSLWEKALQVSPA